MTDPDRRTGRMESLRDCLERTLYFLEAEEERTVDVDCARCGRTMTVPASVWIDPMTVGLIDYECADCTDERLERIRELIVGEPARRPTIVPDDPWAVVS